MSAPDEDKTITLPKSILVPLFAALIGLATGTAGGAGIFGLPTRQDMEQLQQTCKTNFDRAEAEHKLAYLTAEVDRRRLEVLQLEHKITAKNRFDDHDKKLAALEARGDRRPR